METPMKRRNQVVDFTENCLPRGLLNFLIKALQELPHFRHTG